MISSAARRNVKAIVIRQSSLGSLVAIARKTHVGLVVEETESEQSFVDWLNEADDAKALPLVGWSQRYDTARPGARAQAHPGRGSRLPEAPRRRSLAIRRISRPFTPSKHPRLEMELADCFIR